MALFHQTHVILMAGGLIIGALASAIGAPWAAALMSIACTLSMLALYLFSPRARQIR